MRFNPDDPKTWDCFRPLIIAHDVGRSRDRSTAVIGGLPAFNPNLIGIRDAHELPQGSYGSARASELATVDRHYDSESLIIADLSNDPTYAEPMHETFGPRVIGLQISRSGDGMNFERRPVKNSAMLVYTVGRSHLLELYHSLLQSGQVKIADRPTTRRAYEQLMALETEMRESGATLDWLQAMRFITFSSWLRTAGSAWRAFSRIVIFKYRSSSSISTSLRQISPQNASI
jgi:hypothetical protein